MRNRLHHFDKLRASHIVPPSLKLRWASALIIGCINIYQYTLSPDHGPLRHLYPYGYCRHSPTCSQYMKEQVQQRGAVMGSLLGLRQLMTCHPWRTPDAARIQQAMGNTNASQSE